MKLNIPKFIGMSHSERAMFKAQHGFFDMEIALTLHFCMTSWHELVPLIPAVITSKGKLYPTS